MSAFAWFYVVCNRVKHSRMNVIQVKNYREWQERKRDTENLRGSP